MQAIILAAGSGERMRTNRPKQFLSIKGKPMLAYSLEAFAAVESCEKIILVGRAGLMPEYEKIIRDYTIPNVEITTGGKTRQESAFKGLSKVTSKKVMVHEAARPLVSVEFIEEIAGKLEGDLDAVVPVLPIKFTVIEGDGFMENILDRSRLKNVQLPQAFRAESLRKAHEMAKSEGFMATEDSMLVFKYGGKVKLVTGRESLLKITTMFDVEMINKFLGFGE